MGGAVRARKLRPGMVLHWPALGDTHNDVIDEVRGGYIRCGLSGYSLWAVLQSMRRGWIRLK